MKKQLPQLHAAPLNEPSRWHDPVGQNYRLTLSPFCIPCAQLLIICCDSTGTLSFLWQPGVVILCVRLLISKSELKKENVGALWLGRNQRDLARTVLAIW